MAEELPWLSLTEAADVSGLARETVRARARRGLIPSRKGNDGRVVVQIEPAKTEPGHAPDTAGIIAELNAEIGELREKLARTAAELSGAEAVRKAEISALRELVDELRAMLADARRPWWRRWR